MILSIDEKGGIKLGNPPELLPGIVSAASVGGELLFDSSSADGTSGQKYKLKGWKDADISLTLRIIGTREKSRDDLLTEIALKFKATDENGAPIIYDLDFPHTRAWNVTKVFFSTLRTRQSGGKQEYLADLSFREYKPEVAAIQEKKKAHNNGAESLAEPNFPPIYDDHEEINLEKMQRRYANLEAY